MSWAFNIPFKVERGETMKTITAVRGISGKTSDVAGCFDAPFRPHSAYIAVEMPTGRPTYWLAMFFTGVDGSVIRTGRFNTNTGNDIQINVGTWTGTVVVVQGTVYAEIDVSAWGWAGI